MKTSEANKKNGPALKVLKRLRRSTLFAELNFALLVLIAAASRLIPHPPNVTALAGASLFASIHFASEGKKGIVKSFAVPVLALLLSDLFLGWHSTIGSVYFSVVVIVALSLFFRPRNYLQALPMMALSSLLFFTLTNFSVWWDGNLYSRDLSGLMQSYVMALPFFENQILGDFLWTSALFAGGLLARKARFARNSL